MIILLAWDLDTERMIHFISTMKRISQPASLRGAIRTIGAIVSTFFHKLVVGLGLVDSVGTAMIG